MIGQLAKAMRHFGEATVATTSENPTGNLWLTYDDIPAAARLIQPLDPRGIKSRSQRQHVDYINGIPVILGSTWKVTEDCTFRVSTNKVGPSESDYLHKTDLKSYSLITRTIRGIKSLPVQKDTILTIKSSKHVYGKETKNDTKNTKQAGGEVKKEENKRLQCVYRVKFSSAPKSVWVSRKELKEHCGAFLCEDVEMVEALVEKIKENIVEVSNKKVETDQALQGDIALETEMDLLYLQGELRKKLRELRQELKYMNSLSFEDDEIVTSTPEADLTDPTDCDHDDVTSEPDLEDEEEKPTLSEDMSLTLTVDPIEPEKGGEVLRGGEVLHLAPKHTLQLESKDTIPLNSKDTIRRLADKERC